MTPTSSLAGHLEYLVSAPEDPGDRDKRLLDEWTRSVIHSLLLSCLYHHPCHFGTGLGPRSLYLLLWLDAGAGSHCQPCFGDILHRAGGLIPEDQLCWRWVIAIIIILIITNWLLDLLQFDLEILENAVNLTCSALDLWVTEIVFLGVSNRHIAAMCWNSKAISIASNLSVVESEFSVLFLLLYWVFNCGVQLRRP